MLRPLDFPLPAAADFGDRHFVGAQDIWLIEDRTGVPGKRFDNP